MIIRKGDNVIVISGASKGKTGAVRRVFPRTERVLIDGVNLRKKHQRPRRANQKGQMIDVTMPIHVSNVALVEDGKPARTGIRREGEKKVRVSRKSGKAV
jgi:large subunit ribosomal protein L24